jgi:arylsulfatase A-like enzyme
MPTSPRPDSEPRPDAGVPTARPRRRAWGRLLALAGLLSLLSLLFHAWVYGRRDLSPLFDGLESLRARTEDLARRARTFDGEGALAELGPSALNGFVWRLDERLSECTAERGKGAPSLDPKPLLSIEFEPGEALTLVSESGTSTVENGVLRTLAGPGDVLVTSGEFQVDPDAVAQLELRVKHARGTKLSLGWSSGGEAENREVLSLLPVQGEFYDYRIHTETLFQDTSFPFVANDTAVGGARAPIRKLMIEPTDVAGDLVEIDRLRLISKRSKYAESTHDAGWHRAAGELRKVVFANTPLSITAKVSLPAEPLWLTAGLAVLESGDPVRFKVSVREAAAEKTLFEQSVSAPHAWSDVRLDVSEWGGREVEFRFEALSTGGNVAFWSNPTIHGAPREQFHVLLLLEDALRGDHLSSAGHSRSTTPHKDALAAEGVQFLRCYSQESKTRMSVPSMMTSLLPTATGVWNFQEVLHDDYLTLAEVLRSQGFETAAFLQNPNAGAGAGLHQGFSESIELERGVPRAADAFAAAKQWIERHPQRNLFLYVHVLDPHSPYDPPPPFDAWAREELGVGTRVKAMEYYDPPWDPEPTAESRRARYDGEIAYNDACFGQFWSWYTGVGMKDRTLFVNVSDHGEFLGERGMWDHHPPGFEPVLHVPLVLHLPPRLSGGPRGAPGRRTIDVPVQLLDVAPTILDVLGIDRGPLLQQGDSLLGLMRGEEAEAWAARPVVSDEVIDRPDKSDERSLASVFYRDLQLINSANFSSKRPLPHQAYARAFDLRGGGIEAPPEWDLAWDPVFRWRLGRAVAALQRAGSNVWFGITSGVGGSMDYDPETIERLKALGYL